MQKIASNTALCLVLLACLISIAGCKDNTSDPAVTIKGSINGTIEITNPYAGTTNSMPGIMVYLIDENFTSDTTNYGNNKTVIIDSSVTNAAGKYEFKNIKAGSYGVIPLPGSGNYKYSLTTGSDTCSVIISDKKNNYSVNFVTYDQSFTDQSSFKLKLSFKNFPPCTNNGFYSIQLERLQWYSFVPIPDWTQTKYAFISDKDFWAPVEFSFVYGWTCLLYTMSNKFNLTISEAVRQPDNNVKFINYWWASVDLGLSNCPANPEIEINATEHTAKQIK